MTRHCTTLLAVLIITSTTASVDARGCSYGSCIPRHQQRYFDHFWPRRSQYNQRVSTPFDLLTDILSIPIYTNSLARQSDAQLEQMQVSAPRYDIQELAEGYELTMEVPGVSADNLMVEVEDESLLRVSGTREHHGAGRVAVETKFDQTFSLDNVDTSEIKVTLSNGILRITAPKKEKVLKRLLIEQNEAKAAELPVKAVGDKALEESASETEQPPDETIDGLTMSPEQNIDQ